MVFVACSTPRPPEPECTSICGVQLFGSSDCHGFQTIEFATMLAYGSMVDGVFPHQVCHEIYGWRVSVLDGPWVSAGCSCEVAGESWSWLHGIRLADDDWGGNAYAHEMGHVIDHLYRRPPDYLHETWTELGHYGAIQAAQEAYLELSR